MFADQLVAAGESDFKVQCLEPYRLSTQANPRSRPRADFCWEEEKVVVEVEGGTWVRSKYTTGAGIAKTCRKHNFAILDGWSLIRVTGDMIRSKSQEALHTTLAMLEANRGNHQEHPIREDDDPRHLEAAHAA